MGITDLTCGKTDIIFEGPDRKTIIDSFVNQEIIAFDTGRRIIDGAIQVIGYEDKSGSNFYLLVRDYDHEYHVYYDSVSHRGVVTRVNINKRILCPECKTSRDAKHNYCPNCGIRFRPHIPNE